MKKLFIFLFFANVSFAIAQQKYNTENGIHYYDETITKKDSYIESQCTLDIYYPENKKDFATIIWFHGGGLTKGKKQIPGSNQRENASEKATSAGAFGPQKGQGESAPVRSPSGTSMACTSAIGLCSMHCGNRPRASACPRSSCSGS